MSNLLKSEIGKSNYLNTNVVFIAIMGEMSEGEMSTGKSQWVKLCLGK